MIHPDRSASDAATALAAVAGPEAGPGVGNGRDGDGAQPAAASPQLAAKLGLRYLPHPEQQAVSAAFLERVPIAYARRHVMLGLAASGASMPVAIADAAAMDCADALGRLMGRSIEPVLAPREAILAAINAAYQQRSGQTEAMIESLGDDGGDTGRVLAEAASLAAEPAEGDLLDDGGRAPVIRLVNQLLFEAVKMLASDVHVQPCEDRVVVRMRIDGVLFDAFTLPAALREEMVSRLKVMGRMNIAEKRLPQDGRATVQVGDRVIDLRLSVVPTSHGERVVVRLLDKSARLYTLEELGMPGSTLAGFRELIGIEHGLVLVTGPTGSGKTTTLYAALQQLNSTESNVLTLEDPIEYQLAGISQIQVATRKGMTFASGLRSVLRQDPDIIMVGEVRDHETAVLAIQSALTGHLVFSTLHTNDAASAVTRLLDLGTEAYLVASSVVGVMAQRLVRRICDQCAVALAPDEAQQQIARIGGDGGGADLSRMRRGVGCEQCRGTGYRGRLGLFELLMVDDPMRRLIQQQAAASQLKQVGVESGMRTLLDDGRVKVLDGVTTVQEVMRVTLRATR